MTLRLAAGVLALWMVPGCFEDTGEVDTENSTGTTAAATDGTTDEGGTTDDDRTTTSGGTSTSGDTTASSADSSTGADSSGSSGTAECGDCFTGRCDEEGRCERIVFVTSSAYDRDLGAPAGAHDICNDEAAAAELEGTFRALLAVNQDTATAFETLQLDAAPNAVFVLNDDDHSVVADDPDTFRVDLEPQPDLTRPIDHNAQGTPVVGEATACGNQVERVWTGLIQGPDGMDLLGVGGGSCGAWDGGGTNGGTGRLNRVGLGWVAATNCPCIGMASMMPTRAHLYCFEVPDP